jgi:hypothetical protein
MTSNILIKNMGPGDSDPDKGLAGILQVKYRWDDSRQPRQDLLNLLKQVGLKGEVHDNLDLDGALNRMATYPGVYHFMRYGEPPWHCMAADTQPGHYYWYDIQNGLFGYANTDEWKQGIRQRYQPCGRVWVVTKCWV